MKGIALFSVLMTFAVWAQPTSQPATQVDPDAYARALERLNAKAKPTTQAISTQPTTRPVRVIFVLDATGSMMNRWDTIRAQTWAAISELDDANEFNVMISQQEQFVMLSKSPAKATKEWREKAWSMLSKASPAGGGDFGKAVEAALAQRPSAIWVASDGGVPDFRALIEQLRKANHSRVPINTVLHFADSREHQALLWTIASDSGGVCLDRSGKAVKDNPAPEKTAAAPTPPKKDATPPRPTGPSIFRER